MIVIVIGFGIGGRGGKDDEAKTQSLAEWTHASSLSVSVNPEKNVAWELYI